MSTVHGAVTSARRSSVRVAINDRTMLIGLGLLVVLLAALTWQTWGDLGSDTGYDVIASQRLADGEIPYRDFPYFYGPLAPALGALVVLIGGSGLTPFIAFGMVLSVAIVGAVYALARVVASPLSSGLAAAITATIAFSPTNFSFVLPHTQSATIGLLAAVLFLLGVSRFAAGGSRGWLWCAGVSAAAVTLARPEFAVAVWIAGGLWLGLRLRSRSIGRRDVVALVAPAAAIPLVVYGALMAGHVAPPAPVREPVPGRSDQRRRRRRPQHRGADDRRQLRRALRPPRPLRPRRRRPAGRRGHDRARRPRPVRGPRRAGGRRRRRARRSGGAPRARPSRPPVRLRVDPRRGRRRGRRPALASPPWSGEWSPAAQAELLLAAFLVIIAARTYAAFFANATVPQQAAYAIPLAAVFLAWLHDRELGVSPSARRIGAGWLAFLALAGAVLVVADARDRSVHVSGPGGTLSERPGPAASYQAALDTILRETAPGDPVLLAPQLTSLYTLSGRTDPLPQISLLPGSLPDAQAEHEAIRRLDESGVNLAVINTRPLTEYGQGAFGDTYYRSIQDWLDRDFRRVASFGNDGETTVALDVWQRRTS